MNEKVNSENYVSKVLRTESKDLEKIKERVNKDKIIRLLHAGSGMVTEAGEFVDMLKKHIFYGKPFDSVNAREELGDILWYVGIACDVLGTTMDEVMSNNIEKLQKRYPEKFTDENALNRDVEKELEHFGKTVEVKVPFVEGEQVFVEKVGFEKYEDWKGDPLRQSIIQELKELLLKITTVSESDFTENVFSTKFAEDLGMDSLDMVEFQMGVEAKYSITIEDSKYENMTTIWDVVQFVFKKIK